MSRMVNDKLAAIVKVLPLCLDPLSEEDAERFDLYCWRVLELRRSRLIDSGNVAMMVEWQEEGPSLNGLSPNESIEAFESLSVRFRRLILTDEAATFANVRSRLGQLVHEKAAPESEAVQAWLKSLKEGHNKTQTKWALHDVLVPGAGGDMEPLSPKEAISHVFYGEMFHSDPKHAAAFEPLQNWRLSLVAALYHQIKVTSDLHMELAYGIGALLAVPDLLPPGFAPYFSVTPQA